MTPQTLLAPGEPITWHTTYSMLRFSVNHPDYHWPPMDEGASVLAVLCAGQCDDCLADLREQYPEHFAGMLRAFRIPVPLEESIQ